jgi:hypothetical protein
MVLETDRDTLRERLAEAEAAQSVLVEALGAAGAKLRRVVCESVWNEMIGKPLATLPARTRQHLERDRVIREAAVPLIDIAINWPNEEPEHRYGVRFADLYALRDALEVNNVLVV